MRATPTRMMLGTTLVWFLGFAAAMTANWLIWSHLGTAWLEGLAYLVLFLAFVSRSSVCQALARFPLLHRVLISLVIIISLVAQLTERSRTLFPFVHWGMFSAAVLSPYDVMVHEYIGTTVAGQRIAIAPGQVFPSLAHGRLVNKLEGLVERAYPATDHRETVSGEQLSRTKTHRIQTLPTRLPSVFQHGTRLLLSRLNDWSVIDPEEMERQLISLLTAVGDQYNVHHPSNTIHSVDVVRIRLDLRQRPQPTTHRRRLLRIHL